MAELFWFAAGWLLYRTGVNVYKLGKYVVKGTAEYAKSKWNEYKNSEERKQDVANIEKAKEEAVAAANANAGNPELKKQAEDAIALADKLENIIKADDPPNQNEFEEVKQNLVRQLSQLNPEQKKQYENAQREAEQVEQEANRLEQEAKEADEEAKRLEKQLQNAKNAEEKRQLQQKATSAAIVVDKLMKTLEEKREKLKSAQFKKGIDNEMQKFGAEILEVLKKTNTGANITSANIAKLQDLQGKVSELDKKIEMIRTITENSKNKNPEQLEQYIFTKRMAIEVAKKEISKNTNIGKQLRIISNPKETPEKRAEVLGNLRMQVNRNSNLSNVQKTAKKNAYKSIFNDPKILQQSTIISSSANKTIKREQKKTSTLFGNPPLERQSALKKPLSVINEGNNSAVNIGNVKVNVGNRRNSNTAVAVAAAPAQKRNAFGSQQVAVDEEEVKVDDSAPVAAPVTAPAPVAKQTKQTKSNVKGDVIDATIIWKGEYIDLIIYENKECNQITQYLKLNPDTAVIYKMIPAEIEKAKKINEKGDWIAVLCYMKDGRQVNKPITKKMFETDLYNDVIKQDNKDIQKIISIELVAGGKRRYRAVTKKNKRRSKRRHTYRK